MQTTQRYKIILKRHNYQLIIIKKHLVISITINSIVYRLSIRIQSLPKHHTHN